MTDPLEQDVLSFLGGYRPPAPKPVDPLEKDVTSFLSSYKPPTPPKPATTRDPILDRLPPALAADFEKRPEFAAKLAKDRAAGLTDDQILAKIAVGQKVKQGQPKPAIRQASRDGRPPISAPFAPVERPPDKVGPLEFPPDLIGLGVRDAMERSALDAMLADLEHRPEFAAQINRDRTAGLSNDEILDKIVLGRHFRRLIPDWATSAPSTAEASNDALYGQPTGMETAVETAIRASQGVVGTAGALMERTGRKIFVPEEPEEKNPKRAEALSKMRDIYSVGAPGSGTIAAVGEAASKGIAEPLVERGEHLQAEQRAWNEAVPRPKYAREFKEGMKTDPFKTLGISAAENLPNLAITLGAAALAPELGLGVAYLQELGGSYQELDQMGLPEDEKQRISGTIALTNMFLEYLPAGKALEKLGGATKKGMWGLVYDMVEQGIAEGATESIQEANQILETAALSAHDQGITFDQFWDRVLEAGLSAFVLGGATGVAAHVGGSVGTAAPDVQPMPEIKEVSPGKYMVELSREAVANLPVAIRAVVGGDVREVSAAELRGQQGPVDSAGDRRGIEAQPSPASMSDAGLRLGVLDFLGQREMAEITPIDRRINPQPVGEPRERRGDTAARKRVAEMTPEEMTAALLTSEATGLPNRRAWEEQAADKPVHIAIDADGLKWVNDRFGHDTGTQLLRSLGEAIGPLGAYHLQGDEFAMAADTIEEAESRARQIDEALTGTRLRYTAGDGSIYEIPIGASYGIGETYAAADQRSIDAKVERQARGQRAARGEAPPGLVVVSPAGGQARSTAEGELNADIQTGVRRDVPEGERGAPGPRLLAVQDRAGDGGPGEARLVDRPPDDETAGLSLDSGASGPAQSPGGARERGTASTINESAAPESRAQEPQQQAPRPTAPAAVPEPASERDRGPESLPARLVRPRQASGQEGFAVVPSAIKKPIMDWVEKRLTQQGLAPAYYLDLKIKRDNQLAAKAARLDAYSTDLARAIRRYRGPLTPTQLKTYLDDAYRGMNLSGISGPMDETQIGRIERRGRPAPEGEGRQDVKAPAVDLSEQALQRLREDSPGSKFPRETRSPDQSSIGRRQLREMARRREVSEDALVSAVRKESAQSVAMAPEFLPLLREMRSAQDDLARTLRRYGLLDDASIQQLEREFGLYVHRQYEAPRNPKYLKWIQRQSLWRRAYDLTKSLWSRQFAADRAEMIVDDLHLRRPPIDGPLRQGEEVEIGPAGEPKRAPRVDGEEELMRAAAAKPKPRPEIEEVAVAHGKTKVKTLQFLGSDGQQQAFEIRAKPGESRAAAEARTRSGAEARRDAMYPVSTSESLPSGRTGRIVQVKGSEVFVETLNEDGGRETLTVPTTRVIRKFGTKAQAIADVRRTMFDPSTRDRFLEDYQLDADTFDESHAKAREAMPDIPENEIWGMLHSYVESSGNRPVLPGGVPEGSKDMTALKRRGRKDDLERLLKSEVRSVDWNFLTTTLKMATIAAQHRFLVDLERAGKGDIFVEKPEVRNAGTDQEQALTKPVDPGFYAKSIENAKGREPGIDQRIIMQGNRKTMPLADLFTTDEMMEALNQAFDQKSNPAWLRWYMRGVIAAKGAATAQSLISLMRNVWSQPLAVAANGVNPFNLRRFAEAGKLSYPRAVGSTGRTRLARMERYIELGIVDQGTDVGDIKRMERRAHVLREDVPHGAGTLGGRIIRETSRGVMKLYEAPDNQGKIEVFEALLPLYKKAFPEMSTKEVEEHLAAKQRNTMQNYSMTPPLVKDISQFPFIGSFVSFRMESIRNLYHAIEVAAEEARSDNPELRKIGMRRAAGIGFALASTGMVAFALRHWNNMDDDDDEAIRRFMAPWNKNSQVAFLHSIDEDGNVAFIDLSFMDYYSAVKTPFHALLRGDLAGVRDSILDPFGEDVFTKNVMDIWARGGKTKEGFDVYNQEDSTLTKSIGITKHLGAPLTPGIIKQAARVLDPERDKSSEILGLFGVRKTVVNVPKELRRQAKLFADAINDSRWIEKEIIRKPDTEDAYTEAQRRSEVALRRNIEEFVRDIRAARQLGLPESEIAAALIESGFSKGSAAKGQFGEVGLLLGCEVDALVQRYQDLNEKWGEEKRSSSSSR